MADFLAAQEVSGAAKPAAESLILIWLDGGPATIDMWDPKPQAPEEYRGEFAAIDTAVPGVQLTAPLSKVARVLDKCALVRSLHHGLPAHGPGAQYLMTGNLPGPAVEHPSLGAIASQLLPARRGVPPYFALGRPEGRGAGSLGAAFAPFEVDAERQATDKPAEGMSLAEAMAGRFDSLTALRDQLDRRFNDRAGQRVADGMAKFHAQATEILRSDRIGQAFVLDKEPEAVRQAFGSSTIGKNLLTARRLVEAGARFVTVATTGWDTHSNNFNTLRNRLLPPLDQALAALVADLDARGLLENTLVCCVGEFARTPKVNGSAGRDHWARSMAALLAGGGVTGGAVYGSTDQRGLEPTDRPCTPDDLAATLLYCLTGANRPMVTTASGRVAPAIRTGRVLGIVGAS